MSSPTIPTAAEDPSLYANRDGQVISASVTLLVLPTVFVALRVMSRYMSGAGFWWDDMTVVLGMMLSWGPNIINILASHHSLGHHTAVLSQATLMSFYQHLYAFEILYSLGIACVKFSVILFQYRIFPIVSFRRIISACGAFVLAFEVASTVVFILECTPVHDFWVALGGYLAPELGGRCINLVKFLLVNGSINTVTDFALLLTPLPVLWRLRASTLQKYILTGIFISGLVVTAVSMVRLVVIARYHGDDVTYDFVPTCIWTAAEPSIAVVSACLPSLRPLFVRVVWGRAQRPIVEQDDYFGPSNHITPTWRSGSKAHDRCFNRLPDSGKVTLGSWTNNVAVYGGKGVQETEEEILELGSPREDEMETPMNRIRAKTTVVLTISERVDWQDDLF
ncbi:hypothetical protein HO173_012636 [Letharia columbiana]|uniref:Rhodopsin domain-containing protein n=1 Tax=Letharia columbiana TaxID=112416 RepID=A0A8H6CMI7_9LECA|nr:uncharacterized protein HO173_012636 [Letharia columbiana]KAF6225969.1 hypothetical protein HO173_012636 [Letharia columbiana]